MTLADIALELLIINNGLLIINNGLAYLLSLFQGEGSITAMEKREEASVCTLTSPSPSR